MACGLDLQKRPRRTQLGCDTAELTVKRFRFPQRHSGALLLAPGIGDVDECVHGALRHAHGYRTVEQWKDFTHCSIERPRYARDAVREVEEVRPRNERIP